MLSLHCTTAPEPPPSLTATIVNVTSITIQWDPLPCQDRNRDFNRYLVGYFPSSDPSIGNSDLVLENNRVFTISRLLPRTSYTFQVQAFNFRPRVEGLFSNLTVNTSAPSGKLL